MPAIRESSPQFPSPGIQEGQTLTPGNPVLPVPEAVPRSRQPGAWARTARNRHRTYNPGGTAQGRGRQSARKSAGRADPQAAG